MPLIRREHLNFNCIGSWYISFWRIQNATLNFHIQEIISTF